MTTLDTKFTCCAVCGEFSDQTVLGSSNTMEPPDLDTRPGEMLRSTIAYWIYECPHCGYAAPDLEERITDVADIVRSPEYLSNEGRFLRHVFLLRQLGHFAEAGWTALHAAWLADDENNPALAQSNRRLAIALFKQGKASRQNFMNDPNEEFALVTDVCRRAGEFDEALSTCRAGLQGDNLPPLIEDILRLELTLIQNRDDTRHTCAELPERPEGAQRVALDE
ncbi:MAG: hypothetical protein HY821_09120 [Acidobacteria bacterium]|nr:hypothetical protein [Acidobacteriota bacterium]